jgi:hypothetical protein
MVKWFMAETGIAVYSSARSRPTRDERAAHIVMMIASASILAGKFRSGKIAGPANTAPVAAL